MYKLKKPDFIDPVFYFVKNVDRWYFVISFLIIKLY
jgi:hypothetical protein